MKFPCTPHLPGSKSTPDDLWANLGNLDGYMSTEKLDGSNIMMNNKKFITRKGLTSGADWTYPARTIQQSVGHLIPKGMWLAGELMTWRKSIAYENLPSQYIVFGVVKGNHCLPWDEVVNIAEECGLPTARVLVDDGTVNEVTTQSTKMMSEAMEGFVIRPRGWFQLPHYPEHVAKFVGSHHEPVATNNGKNSFSL